MKRELDGKFNDPHITWNGIGSFIFLRLLNVSISCPEFFGLLKGEPTQSMRRALVLVAKVINFNFLCIFCFHSNVEIDDQNNVTQILQNLSTHTLFGNKEGYMSNFNELLESNFKPLEEFYDAVAVSSFHFDFKSNSISTKTEFHKISHHLVI